VPKVDDTTKNQNSGFLVQDYRIDNFVKANGSNKDID
jgi:hypothetical protein